VLGLDDAAVMFAGITGIDLTGIDPDTRVADLHTDLGQTLINRYARTNPDIRVRAVLDQFRTKAIRGFQITGSPEQVADEIIAIVDGSGIDGIMLEPTFGGPASYEAFIELVLPILIERGRAGTPEGATLRERLSGSPRLAPTHRAHRLTATDASAEASVTAPLAAAT
ncbi:MAG TPA: hypothetical protein DCO91_08085, partial [Microbacterium sp.]|nr:hypothetical protein [Microbacterium sp.]